MRPLGKTSRISTQGPQRLQAKTPRPQSAKKIEASKLQGPQDTLGILMLQLHFESGTMILVIIEAPTLRKLPEPRTPRVHWAPGLSVGGNCGSTYEPSGNMLIKRPE